MSFDLLAPHYRWMEAILAGDKIQRCRVHFLDSVSNCRRALLVGEGNGRFLGECLKKMPHAQFTVVDASEKMLEQARRRCGGDSRINYVRAQLPGAHLPKNFDLIVTNCFLDCFDERQLPTVVNELADCATDSAIWLVTDFCVPKTGWAKWRAKMVLAAAYSFFQVATGIPARRICAPDPFLVQNGFRFIDRIEADAGLIYSSIWKRSAS
jgi:ubiquinone/menaquinone biosynthesis C-methylase UbiE